MLPLYPRPAPKEAPFCGKGNENGTPKAPLHSKESLRLQIQSPSYGKAAFLQNNSQHGHGQNSCGAWSSPILRNVTGVCACVFCPLNRFVSSPYRPQSADLSTAHKNKLPGSPVAVCFPCTLPRKPATVTEQNSNLAISVLVSLESNPQNLSNQPHLYACQASPAHKGGHGPRIRILEPAEP